MAAMGRAVLASAPALLRQRDLKCKHGEKQNKKTTTKKPNRCLFWQSHEKYTNKIKAAGGGGGVAEGGLLALQRRQTNTTTKI